MENIAYTLAGDHSTQSREAMKASALAFALDKRAFLAPQLPAM
jgi:hypothetical protein